MPVKKSVLYLLMRRAFYHGYPWCFMTSTFRTYWWKFCPSAVICTRNYGFFDCIVFLTYFQPTLLLVSHRRRACGTRSVSGAQAANRTPERAVKSSVVLIEPSRRISSEVTLFDILLYTTNCKHLRLFVFQSFFVCLH